MFDAAKTFAVHVFNVAYMHGERETQQRSHQKVLHSKELCADGSLLDGTYSVGALIG